jgi:protein SCO1/2
MAAALLALGAPPVRAHQFSSEELGQVSFDQRPGQQIPLDLPFRDETGREAPLRSYFGPRPMILTLNYYHCPNLCSTALQSLADRLRTIPFTLGQQYSVLTVSIDPRETPAQAAEKRAPLLLGQAAGSEADWHLLTGQAAAIDQLASAVGFHAIYDPQEDEYIHPAGLIVLTPGGQVSRYLYGLDVPPNDLRLALVEAGQGRVGSLVDQIALLCYHYDASTGKYTPLVLGAVRLAGLATLLGLGLFLGALWRDDLRRQRGHSGSVS